MKIVHPQVTLLHQGMVVEVDAELVELILAIWSRGIETLLSCQELTPGVTWIKFASVADACRFLDRGVLPIDIEDRAWCAVPWRVRVHRTDVSREVCAQELSVVHQELLNPSACDPDRSVSVWFPKEVVGRIADRLRAESIDRRVRAPTEVRKDEDES